MRRALLALVVLAAGCGEAAFSAHARDNDVGDLQRAMAASAKPAERAAQPMAFLVSDGKLIGFDLAGGRIAWEQPADVKSRVVVGAGSIAYRQGASDIVVRAAATGDVRATARLEPGETFAGAALDGDKLVYVVQTADKRAAVVALDAGGKPLWRRDTPSALGAPAARGGLVAVPFAHQNLVLLDGATGRELARVRATDEEIAWTRATPEGIYYGGAHGIYRLDDKSAAGSRAGSSYAEARLPGEQVRTAYHWDGYEPAQTQIGAFDRNRLLWRGREGSEDGRGSVRSGDPSARRNGGFRDDLAVLHTYRFFFAFDAARGKLRWVYAHPRSDVVASDDAGSAIVFASADGDLGVVDPASGAVRVIARTGLRLAGASFDADGLTAGTTATPPTEEDVARTLEQIVWDHDARFGPVKVFAVDALGAVPGVSVSRALLKIVRAPAGAAAGAVPPMAREHAGEALVARRDRAAVPDMLTALGDHYDFLDDKQPRGIDVLARALSSLEVREAAPLLAAHLADHETPERALKDVAQALAHLGGADAEHALREFLLEYHADPAFLMDPAPLYAAGEALVDAGVEARRAVAFVVDDRRTLQPVARQLRVTLDEAVAREQQKKQEQGGPQAAPEIKK